MDFIQIYIFLMVLGFGGLYAFYFLVKWWARYEARLRLEEERRTEEDNGLDEEIGYVGRSDIYKLEE